MEFESYVAGREVALLRFAYLLTADAHQAEDLMQTVLIDAYRHWRRIDRASNPDAYIKRMMVNAHISWWRRLSNREVPTEISHAARSPMTDDPAEDIVVRDAALGVLRGLPPRSRAVLVLRYYADYDDRTIAEILRIRESTVRSQASRALTQLRQVAGTAHLHQLSAGD